MLVIQEFAKPMPDFRLGEFTAKRILQRMGVECSVSNESKCVHDSGAPRALEVTIRSLQDLTRRVVADDLVNRCDFVRAELAELFAQVELRHIIEVIT